MNSLNIRKYAALILWICLAEIINALSCQEQPAETADPSLPKVIGVLPYPVGKTYYCSLSFFGHTDPFTYAVDFDMPIGTVITAALPGKVVVTRNSYSDENYNPGEENFVIIQYNDSLFARYIHLTKNGALAKVNQLIKPGDTIALSGKSGTPTPHLHFDVTRGGNDPTAKTIPVYFSNTEPHPNGLKAGENYTAMPY